MPIRGPQSVDVGVRKHPPSRRSAPNPGGLTAGRWALGLVAGVNYLHNCNPVVIHGDIKSMNVLLDANKNAVLCDFGMANAKTETSASTATGGGKGIPVGYPHENCGSPTTILADLV